MKSLFGFIILALALSSCEPSLSQKEIRRYREQGDEIVQSASEKLSGTLMSKMKEGGASAAIGFCNQSALPITKKMAAYHGVEIKRTSLRIRNPENLPNEEELKVLHHYQDRIEEGKELNPLVSLDRSGKPNYYAPIRVQQKCLMCHGTLERELSSTIDSILKVKYPEDLAVGYNEGDLRGIWSISFPEIEK
ncbi:MAG: DUF3365 domain-containing protein [Lutimonas sp.]